MSPAEVIAVNEVLHQIGREVIAASRKFPDFPPNSKSAWKAQTIIAEEAGEIAKEMLHFTDEPHKGATLEGIRQEAIQTAAMCVRFVQALDNNELVFI